MLIAESDVLDIELPSGGEQELYRSSLEDRTHANLGFTSHTPARGFATLEENERLHISRVLEHTRGRIAGRDGAAAILGLPPSTLRSRMKKLGLN